MAKMILEPMPLQGCRLELSYNFAIADICTVANSLRRHVERLGGVFVPVLHHETVIEGVLTTSEGGAVQLTIEGFLCENGTISFDEHILQAAAGVMLVHGRTHGDIRALGINYISEVTAVLALTGLVAHAFRQAENGEIASFCLSMYRCALLTTSQYLAAAGQESDAFGLPPIEQSDVLPLISQDGIDFEIETLNAAPWIAFWSALGVEMDIIADGWLSFQQRYACALCRLPQVFFDLAASYSYADMLAVGESCGLSLCPLKDNVEHAELPCFDALYQEGCETVPSEKSHILHANDTLPLKSVSVVESCRRIQGPMAGYVLSMLGADVCRIEPLGGDPLRFATPAVNGCSVRFDAINRGKNVSEVDLKSNDGRQSILQTIRQADIFLQNWAPGKAAQFGLDYEDLSKNNPSIIYAYCGGWKEGNHTTLPGTDFMVQAYSGLARLIAFSDQGKGGTLMTITDVFAGILGAMNIVLALFTRQKNQMAAYVYSSLESAAEILLTARTQADPLRGLYRLQDGWVLFKFSDSKQESDLLNQLNLRKNKQGILAGETDLCQADIHHLAIDNGCAYSVLPSDMEGVGMMPYADSHIRKEGYFAVKALWEKSNVSKQNC